MTLPSNLRRKQRDNFASPPIYALEEGESPLVATAIHNGHALRDEVADQLILSDEERRREEDPYTEYWTTIADTRAVGRRSRFEVDFNRPREKAVYRRPEDAWGLEMWRETPLPEDMVNRSLNLYDAFYSSMEGVFSRLRERHGRFVVLDIHSYNHRRKGPNAEPDSPQENPEVNIGTGSLNRTRWAPVVNKFMEDLSNFDYNGRSLDVRENVRFTGGHFSQWTHATFPDSACVLAIEFKKFFMDEWTGEPYEDHILRIRKALESTIPGVMTALKSCPLPTEART